MNATMTAPSTTTINILSTSRPDGAIVCDACDSDVRASSVYMKGGKVLTMCRHHGLVHDSALKSKGWEKFNL